MNISVIIFIVVTLLTFALGLQALEIFLLTKRQDFCKVWSFENLKSDLEVGIPLPHSWIAFLFSMTGLRVISLLQLLVCILGFFYFHPLFFIILFLTHLFICIRFRGTFNGGSDMMAFVVLTGLLICFISPRFGLIYIAIHTIFSYFKAGLVKILGPDWRKGSALPGFLERSLFPDIISLSAWLSAKPFLSLILGWLVLIFEFSILLLPFFPPLIMPYLFGAILFHFIIYICFGLNRFFWIWLSAWPAVIFSIVSFFK